MPDFVPDAVARLAMSRRDVEPFLAPHHVAAASRLAQTFERAMLRQRVTMSYDPTRVGGRGSGSPARDEIPASAANARSQLNALAASMPGECWLVLFDICGLHRGLQEVETERDWPRRGGKLVLRIALSTLAAHYGLNRSAEGSRGTRSRHWLPARPPLIPGAE